MFVNSQRQAPNAKPCLFDNRDTAPLQLFFKRWKVGQQEYNLIGWPASGRTPEQNQ